MQEETENTEETAPEKIRNPKGAGRPKGSISKKAIKYSKRRSPETIRRRKAADELRKRRESGDLTRKPRTLGYSRNATKDKTEELKDAKVLSDALSTTKIKEFEENTPELKELSEQQRMILSFKMRGLNQAAIAKILKVSQPYVSKQVKHIRELFQARGKSINQDMVLGETISLYEEVEQQAWMLYSSDKEIDKLKALSLIVSARKENVKLLMDLGKLERVGTTSEVKLTVSPFLEKWKTSEDPRDIAKTAIVAKLPELEAPEPPEIEDAEIVEDE